MPDTALLSKVLDDLRNHRDAHVEALRAFVAMPSISTDPNHADDVRAAASWVAERLASAGPLEVAMLETPLHPVVSASWNGAPGAPTVLVYGHLDVQPADPIEAWDSDPFTLTERNGRWYARGISDDKASMLIPILVAEAFFRNGAPPVNLRFLFEAEEEVGSPHLPSVLGAHADSFACDVVLSADGGMWRPELPTITTSARGMVALEIHVQGPSKDLHSGRHGGGVHNPLHALARIVASLHDEEGRIRVEGFLGEAPAPSAERLAHLAELPFNERAYLEEVGAPQGFGEPEYDLLARQWLRPTLEVNGMGGGYQGPGTKTVLPSRAVAKITARLVPGQDPATVRAAIERHVAKHTPPGVRVTTLPSDAAAEAYEIPSDHPALDAARAVLAEVFGRPALDVGMGGSVPIVRAFERTLGAPTVFFSFSTADEDIHAPNEFYRPERFSMGLEAWARLWTRLASTSLTRHAGP